MVGKEERTNRPKQKPQKKAAGDGKTINSGKNCREKTLEKGEKSWLSTMYH